MLPVFFPRTLPMPLIGRISLNLSSSNWMVSCTQIFDPFGVDFCTRVKQQSCPTFLQTQIQLSQHQLLKRLCFLQGLISVHLTKLSWLLVWINFWGFHSVSLICMSILCQYQTFYYSCSVVHIRSDFVNDLAFCHGLKLFLVILCLLCFHMNLRIINSRSKTNVRAILVLGLHLLCKLLYIVWPC